jgi:hypothetical protein
MNGPFARVVAPMCLVFLWLFLEFLERVLELLLAPVPALVLAPSVPGRCAGPGGACMNRCRLVAVSTAASQSNL